MLWGLVPAAGAGIRFGGPKALARRDDGAPWLHLAVAMLRDAGCAEVIVILGAASDEAAALVPASATAVRVDGWAEGLSVSLRAGLVAAAAGRADAVLISPVDTPDADPAAARRVIAAAAGGTAAAAAAAAAGTAAAAAAAGTAAADARRALVQAVYGGVPGHPVLIGRDHWPALADSMTADAGARPYLAAHGVREIECSDLWSGADIDERQPPARDT